MNRCREDWFLGFRGLPSLDPKCTRPCFWEVAPAPPLPGPAYLSGAFSLDPGHCPAGRPCPVPIWARDSARAFSEQRRSYCRANPGKGRRALRRSRSGEADQGGFPGLLPARPCQLSSHSACARHCISHRPTPWGASQRKACGGSGWPAVPPEASGWQSQALPTDLQLGASPPPWRSGTRGVAKGRTLGQRSPRPPAGRHSGPSRGAWHGCPGLRAALQRWQ